MALPTVKDVFDSAFALQNKMVESKNYVDLPKIKQQFNDILNAVPNNVQALQNLAVCEMIEGHNGLAINMLLKVVAELPKYDGAWCNLGIAYRCEGFNDEAIAAMKKAVEINRTARNLENLGTLYVNEGIPDEGLKIMEEAAQMEDANDSGLWNLGLLKLEQCDYKKGFPLYEAGLLCKERNNKSYLRDGNEVPFWQGQPVNAKGKRPLIVVYGEQGIGDEIMFATAMQDLIEKADVILDCHPRLTTLFKRAPWAKKLIAIYGDRKKEGPQTAWQGRYKIDFKLPIGSLFRWFRLCDIWPKIAYLDAKPLDVKKFGPPPYIGVGWTGGTKKTHERYRTVMFEDLMDSIRDKPGTYFSLQYQKDYVKNEIAQAKAAKTLPENFVELDCVYEKNYERTAELIAALDYCVLPNTSAVHLAGAMGHRCFTFTPIQKAWRYCTRDGRMVMYPSVDIVQQVHGESMKDVMHRAFAIAEYEYSEQEQSARVAHA